MILEIINTYGAEIIGTVLVTLFGIFGMIAKNLVPDLIKTLVTFPFTKTIDHQVRSLISSQFLRLL